MPELANDLRLLLLAVLAAFVYIGWHYRTIDSAEYHTVNRRAGVIRSTFSLFTVVGAPHFAIFTSLAYIFHWYPLAFYLGAFAGLFALGQLSPRIRTFQEHDAHTYCDIASIVFGRVPAVILTLFGMLFMIGVAVVQVILGAQLLSEIVDGLSYNFAAVILTVTIVGYLYWGGYRSVLYTDVVQGVFMLFFTGVLAFYVWTAIAGLGFPAVIEPNPNFATLPMMPMIPLLFAAGVVATIGAPEIWQRVLTAASDEVATKSLRRSGAIMLLWGFFVITVGVAISSIAPDAVPATAFVTFVATMLPAWLIGIVLVILTSAMLSTADTEIFASAVAAQKEWMRIIGRSSQALSTRTTKLILITLGAATIVGVVFLPGLLDAWGILINVTYIIAPLATSLLIDRSRWSVDARRRFFFFALCSSLGVFLFVSLSVGDFFSWWATLIIGLASVALFPRISLERFALTRK